MELFAIFLVYAAFNQYMEYRFWLDVERAFYV